MIEMGDSLELNRISLNELDSNIKEVPKSPYSFENDEFNQSNRSNRSDESLMNLIDLRLNEVKLVQPVQSVHRFHLHSERSSGTIGVLILTNSRLKFVNYQEIENVKKQSFVSREPQNNKENDERKKNSFHIPPFDLHPFCQVNEIEEEDIDLINMYSTRVVREDQQVLLTILCYDFRIIEFSMSNNKLVKSLIDQLEELVSSADSFTSSFFLPSPFHSHKSHLYPFLWSLLSSNYPYNHPLDWEMKEGYWLTGNGLLRISECNKSLRMCPTLPQSFITLNSLHDKTLSLFAVSTNGGRVPVVTYSHKYILTNNIFNFLLVRSCALNDDLIDYLTKSLSPLKVVEVASLVPPMPKLLSAYTHLRKTCSFYADKSNFLSRTSKWLRIVSNLMSEIKKLVEILNKSSLLLIEKDDNIFNPLISSLIQVIIDKKRRTINGFEHLISKEWIYLCGVSSNSLPKLPDIMMFTLFLDIVWQLMIQNEYQFEFTSIYLIRLYDLQTIPWNKKTDMHIEKNANHKRSDTLEGLNLTQLMFLHNSYYREHEINFSCDIIFLQLWKPLYLRWLTIPDFDHYYDLFPHLEFIQYQYLLKKVNSEMLSKPDSDEEICESYL